MRTAATALILALACLGAGCSSQEDSLLVVSVDGPDSVASAYYLRVTVKNADQQDYHQFPSGATTSRIKFPTSLGLNVPRARQGSITLDIDALDLSMKTVASGTGTIALDVGNRVDLCIGLSPCCTDATNTSTNTSTSSSRDGGVPDAIQANNLDSVGTARGGLTAGLRFAHVAAGTDHSCASATDGSLWCWGANASGQLGTGDTRDALSPVRVAGTSWTDVAAGSAVTCALQSDNSLWCWGNNSSGQVGNGTAKAGTSVTIPLQLAGTWAGASVGSYHVAALRQGGSLLTWGDNSSDQLGDSSAPSAVRSTPGLVNDSAWLVSNGTFSAGNLHTCAIAPDHGLWCWGNNATGQLGDGTTHMRLSPTQIAGTDWAQVSGGFYHTCALKTDQSLWCWGDNSNGQLGIGNTTANRAPIQITAPAAKWTAVSAGHSHTCGLQKDGSLWCWGGNTDGQLGTAQASNTPVQVTGGPTAWSDVSAGDGHTCAVAADASLWCWGRNKSGQIGIGTVNNQATPIRLGS
jgi:alpha-tubulin suppressor-like RCC1 family protein